MRLRCLSVNIPCVALLVIDCVELGRIMRPSMLNMASAKLEIIKLLAEAERHIIARDETSTPVMETISWRFMCIRLGGNLFYYVCWKLS